MNLRPAFSLQHESSFSQPAQTWGPQDAPLSLPSPERPYFAPLLPRPATLAHDQLAHRHFLAHHDNHHMASIPLHCNICPKKPDFSDVSHLLTHIASKGHLSHYYKLKVRSGTEPDSRELVEEYDQWYAEWNVEDLMSERMNLKDKKRPRNRASSKYCRIISLLESVLF